MTEALKHRTIPAAIAERLRDEILGGAHESGAQLRQEAIATAFGVSRIPVREALLQLEAEGLVEIVPHKGAVVTGISQVEVDDIFALRRVLEVRLLRHSMPKLKKDDFIELDKIQRAFSDAIRQHNTGKWGALNAQLHIVLYHRANLPRTMMIVGNLLTASERYTRIQLSTKTAWKRAQAEHAELINLCRDGKTQEACSLLEAHIAAVHRDLTDMLLRSSRKQKT